MRYTVEDYQHSVAQLRERIGYRKPDVLLILGSGLGFLGDTVKDAVRVPYKELDNFPASTAPGHVGQFVFGTLAGKQVAVMQGRVHTYEGYDYEQVSYAVRVLRLLGARTLLVTNAGGAVNTGFHAGEIMLITDHIKLFGDSPLRGENLNIFGPRFPDSSHLYTPVLQMIAVESARELGIHLNQGVYMFFPGPQYETPAEVRAARVLGADAVGMSTVPEAITAGHCGMNVLGFSLATNMAAGVLDQPLSEEEVLEAANLAKDDFSALVLRCLEKM